MGMDLGARNAPDSKGGVKISPYCRRNYGRNAAGGGRLIDARVSAPIIKASASSDKRMSDTPSQPTTPPPLVARQVMRGVDRAYLGTLMRPDAPGAGQPYTSLVLVALDHDASPILLISTLADHTKNLLASPAASLLFDGTAGLDEPLTGPRVTVQGTARHSTDAHHRAR